MLYYIFNNDFQNEALSLEMRMASKRNGFVALCPKEVFTDALKGIITFNVWSGHAGRSYEHTGFRGAVRGLPGWKRER